MRRLLRAAPLIAAAALGLGCKPKVTAPPAAELPARPADVLFGEPPSTDISAMIEACTIRMSSPESREWFTFWDPTVAVTGREGPSHAHSLHWANAAEKNSLETSRVAVPLEITCSSRGPPDIAVSLAAISSKGKDIPLGPGTYSIVGKSGKTVQPGQLLASALLFNRGIYEATRGTLTLEKFDREGVKGSFKISGKPTLVGGQPIDLEGSFDIPCRGGLKESDCTANKAVARE